MLGSFIAIEGFGIVFLTTVRSSLIFNFSYLFLDFSYSINIFCKCLSVSYNKMLERLSEAFKIQRQFTENAAHELQTVGRDETIIVNALIDEVLADLEPLAQEKNIKLIGKCKDVNMVGSDILI